MFNLNNRVVAETPLGALQQWRAINEQRSFAFVDHKEISVAAQFDGSLATRYLMGWSFER